MPHHVKLMGFTTQRYGNRQRKILIGKESFVIFLNDVLVGINH
jgi:hypothetical protein